jgi:hypothetical protein
METLVYLAVPIGAAAIVGFGLALLHIHLLNREIRELRDERVGLIAIREAAIKYLSRRPLFACKHLDCDPKRCSR